MARSVIAVLLAAAASQALVSAAVGAGPVVLPWPRCAPLCAHAPSHGPRITAIYVSTQQTRGRAIATIDAFAAGIPGRSVMGRLCYEAHHAPTEPGCIVTATTHGRRVGAGVWWLRFHTRVYERYQITNSSSHALLRSYWFGVSVPARDTSVEGSRQGLFHFASPQAGSKRGNTLAHPTLRCAASLLSPAPRERGRLARPAIGCQAGRPFRSDLVRRMKDP